MAKVDAADRADLAQCDNSPSWFTRVSQSAARWTSRSPVLFGALGAFVVWIAVGPWLNFNGPWQLVTSTAFTIITFLIVQTSQNRALTAVQIKLDELISAVKGAREELFDLEDLDEEELERLRDRFAKRAAQKRARADGTASSDADAA
jgi:low affinity Fe/Cu permease